ncbi:hypothetical protein CPC08DRAFT_716399 [Agrocybe pediades]|nr:hypothetical protein CPC08DRAFT_716399 [Agrocybe pediades]
MKRQGDGRRKNEDEDRERTECRFWNIAPKVPARHRESPPTRSRMGHSEQSVLWQPTTLKVPRLSHLLQPSTHLLTRIFKLSYSLLPSSPAPLNALKQCLHYDPNSNSRLKFRRTLASFKKSFTKLDELQEKED